MRFCATITLKQSVYRTLPRVSTSTRRCMIQVTTTGGCKEGNHYGHGGRAIKRRRATDMRRNVMTQRPEDCDGQAKVLCIQCPCILWTSFGMAYTTGKVRTSLLQHGLRAERILPQPVYECSLVSEIGCIDRCCVTRHAAGRHYAIHRHPDHGEHTTRRFSQSQSHVQPRR